MGRKKRGSATTYTAQSATASLAPHHRSTPSKHSSSSLSTATAVLASLASILSPIASRNLAATTAAIFARPPSPLTTQSSQRNAAVKRKRRRADVLEATGFTEWRDDTAAAECAFVSSLDSDPDFSSDAGNMLEEGDGDEGEDDDEDETNASRTVTESNAMVLIGEEEVWRWHTEQEHAEYARCFSTSAGDATPDESAVAAAIALMWEPNRGWYGKHAWWAWDQFPQNSLMQEADKDLSGVQRPAKFVRLDEEEEDIPASIGIQELHGRDLDMSDFGMEVDRDVVYDENELTPEEIEIQRWSIAWRQKRALEVAAEKERNRAQAQVQREQAQQAADARRQRQSLSYKQRVYPILYGSDQAAASILSLEMELQALFDSCGGAGIVPPVIPVGAEDELRYYYQEVAVVRKSGFGQEEKRKRQHQTATEKSAVKEEVDMEDGEMEDDKEEGELEDTEQTEPVIWKGSSHQRVLWPVLPLG